MPHPDNYLIILCWHLLVGYLITITFDWNWIPLTPEEKKRGPSLDEIRTKLFDLDQFLKNWEKDFKE